jgi:carbon-monoxide dehydrogenase medium subunit
MQEFTYYAPVSVAEAIHLISDDPAHSKVLAGGTDLVLAMEYGHQDARSVIDLKRIAELDGIRGGKSGEWIIGAMTRMADLESHAEIRRDFPALAEAAAVVGGPPTRNRATLGGNVCNASPAADTSPVLLALGAEMVIAGATGDRRIPLHQFWEGPGRTTLAPGELLREIVLPRREAGSGCAFQRLTRSAMDIALVNAAARVTLDGKGSIAAATVALGAVAPVVITAGELGEALAGQPWTPELRARVTALASAAAQPIDDVRASAEYRREMAGVLAARAVEQAVARAEAG